MLTAEETRPGRLGRLEGRLVDRLTRQQLARLSAGTSGGSPRSWWRLLGTLVALPVHALSVSFIVGGVVLLITGDGWPLTLLGMVLLLVAFGTRPTATPMPDHICALRRGDAPAFFDALDAVAARTGAIVPRVVLIVEDFNAFATRVGWRRIPVLGIGAPLWVAAAPQARLALLGHELGHFAHGDLTHGWWVGGAQESLLHWLDIAGGTHHVTTDEVEFVQRYLMAPLRGLLTVYLLVITWVNAPGHQRQEYLADMDAVEVGGTDGAVMMLDLFLIEGTVSTAITRAAVSPHRPDVWKVLTDAVNALSMDARERLRAASSSRGSRIDDTHPATALRLQLVQSLLHRDPSVAPDPAQWETIDEELAPAMLLAARHVTDQVRYQW